MPYVYRSIVLVISAFTATLLAQNEAFSITNYQLVGQQVVPGNQTIATYRADLVNAGMAQATVTAGVTSLSSSIQILPGQNTLIFSSVPAQGRVTSQNTFTVTFSGSSVDLSQLQWSFQTPIANAGPNQHAKLGATITLNGTGSTNPSGAGTLAYHWAFASRPPGTSTVLFFVDSPTPYFTVDVAGTYVITLTVSNGSGSDMATVTVSTGNTPPMANAGPNQTARPGSTVTLNGSGSSDVDGDQLRYAWMFIAKPAGSTASLTSINPAAPTFVVDKSGTYILELIVNDGSSDSLPSLVTITTQNTPPVANAGPNQVVSVGAPVQLDASKSSDVDGDALTYSWTLVARPQGSSATLANANAVNPTFTADVARSEE